VRYGLTMSARAARDHASVLAMVLLPDPVVPTAADVIAAYDDLAPDGPPLAIDGDAEADGAAAFTLGDAAVSIGLVPDHVVEAEGAAPYSLATLGERWTRGPQPAHLLVFARQDAPGTAASMAAFCRLAAAVASASGAAAVYFGGGHVTHGPDFLVAAARGEAPMVLVWNGLSVIEADGRLQFLSLGMQQLGLPDLLLTVPADRGNDGFDCFVAFLDGLADRGEPFPDGDSIGRTEDEVLPIRYVESPVDPAMQVWRVDLP
jgi:hypothetical protein